MSILGTSPPLIQGFCTSVPTYSDPLKFGSSSGRPQLFGRQLRPKALRETSSPVTPLYGFGFSQPSCEDESPFTYAFGSSSGSHTRKTRSCESNLSRCGVVAAGGLSEALRARPVKPTTTSVGFRVNRKSSEPYKPPVNGQAAYSNDVKPLGLLKLQLSKGRSEDAGLGADRVTDPQSPVLYSFQRQPFSTPAVQREARTAGEDTSPAIAHTLGTTPRSALEANLKLADGCDSLLKEAQARHAVFNDRVVRRAFCIARSAHTGNYRQNGDPCLEKCVDIALVLADYGFGASVVAAGLLNDCLDDSMMTEDCLRQLFHDQIVDMVVGVGKMRSASALCSTSLGNLCEADLDRLRTMLLVMTDVNVMMIKLADQLRLLETMDGLPEAQVKAVVNETRQIFIPLANRLGVWRLKSQMEDTCFRFEDPAAYQELSASLRSKCDSMVILDRIANIQEVLKAKDVRYQDITGRTKNIYGVHKKMVKKSKKLEEIFDLRAMRIVVNTEVECYKVLDAVHELWAPLKTKDYVRSPKSNGYQSLHTIIVLPDGCPLEVQIRTERMDQVAEYGLAAHWRYKEDSPGGANPFHERQVEWARFVLSWQAEVNDHKLRVDPGHATCSHGKEGCTFPNHRPGCKHKRLETEPVPSMSLGRLETDPTYVIVKNGSSVVIQMLPPKATLGTMRKQLAQVQCMDDVCLVVNNVCLGEEERSREERKLLNMGDVVELVAKRNQASPSPGSSPVLSHITDDAVQRERQRLSQLWGDISIEQPVHHLGTPKARPVRLSTSSELW
eukprot:CAMPEP_0198225446 /NCGR_PEP_ID=MMETSP1445-20131203/101114_1 /TAXON_ID=36898 /ORGANISM="Pyramimonas sp., Strain CCMP2087" /LENGTH=783 /DNA_ID=CAMNT_0043904967 /DNA_START=186 /DNA_END=2534 /DNA_ORIENTATION=-